MLHVLSESELSRASDRRERLGRLGFAVAKPAIQPAAKVSLERQILDAAFHAACLKYFNWCMEDAEPPRPAFITIEVIIARVARRHRISRGELVSHRRQVSLCRARQIAMWLCKELTTKSYPAIARQFEHRDHSTIHYAVQKIEALRKQDHELQAELDRFVSALRPHNPQDKCNAEQDPPAT